VSELDRSYPTLAEFAEGYREHYGTILIDPPWRFQNRTGKVAPEHLRLNRYSTLSLEDMKKLPVGELGATSSHLYMWCPNALLPDGLELMKAWGYSYKTNLIWYKVRKDGGPDGRGVGFYFRNVTEVVLFGIKGKLRTLPPARSQTNIIVQRKREHSKKPDEQYQLIEDCSPGPHLELFARERQPGWDAWGDQVDTYEQSRPRYRGYDWDKERKTAPANDR
jgi:N6-adenosine-specific RNA methylase IME4